jgi:predicted molibdopterin-dependent oxidoreductase YjgC
MTLPGFTAEASLAKVKERYILTSKGLAETGMVVPQFCYRTPGSPFETCGECFDTDGDGVPDNCYIYRRPVGIPFM